MRLALGIFVLFCFFWRTLAVLDGESTDWERKAFLVKVVSRLNKTEPVSSCTGTLVTSNLVITAPECVGNEDNDIFEEVAIIFPPRYGIRKLRGLVAARTHNFAAIRIKPLKLPKVCPPKPQTKGIIRMNLEPQLGNKSVIAIADNEIMNSKCEMLGFKTMEKADDFLKTNEVLRIPLNQLEPNTPHKNSFRSLISNNFTACFDDAGAPLICETATMGKIYVGMLRSLQAPKDFPADEELKAHGAECAMSYAMTFSLLTKDRMLIDNFNTIELSRLIGDYEKCEFMPVKPSD